jgi:DNA-binding NtrC family response regulator
MPHALIVEDDHSSLVALQELVQGEGFSTSTAKNLADARAEITEKPPAVLLVDLVLPDGSGIDLLKEMGGAGPQVVLITGHASIDTAVEALRTGACDYLTKPLDIARLKTVLANIARTNELREEISSLRMELRKLGRFGPMIGASPTMENVYDLIGKVAGTEATVIVTGESGTGKELVAQTVHELSRRRKAPFLPLNCGAVTPNLIESELFGHERGSFTGADRVHKGHFERASGGTLFLDEITEMPLELQVKLLRVLETGTVMRLGGERPIEVDVRVVAATNRVPEEAVREGKLREDLLYRLQVFPIHLPPLRERGDDVVLLANHFLEMLNQSESVSKRFTPAAVAAIRAHNWPGNVRELKNAIHRAFILAETEIGITGFSSGDQPPLPVKNTSAAGGTNLQVRVGTSVADAERSLILATLEECDGDKKRAAEILQISLKTLYNRLNEYKVE